MVKYILAIVEPVGLIARLARRPEDDDVVVTADPSRSSSNIIVYVQQYIITARHFEFLRFPVAS